MSDDSMREKFGRRLRGKETFGFGFDVDFEVESYLRYRGSQFVNRFDANSYLYITKAMDYFDLTNGNGSLAAALEPARARFLVISFSSDWLYPSYQSQEMVRALRSRNRDVAYVELQSNYGHDSFLVDVAEQSALVRGFLVDHVREDWHDAQIARSQAFVRELLGRSDYAIIGDIVEPGSRGAGPGLRRGRTAGWLARNKGVDARGVEISGRQGAARDRARRLGVPVRHRPGARGLSRPGVRLRDPQPDAAGDATVRGRCCARCCAWDGAAIVAFPNFGHWSVRLSMLLSGRAPRTKLFPYEWYESPNIHFLTVHDFENLAHAGGPDGGAPVLPRRASQGDGCCRICWRKWPCTWSSGDRPSLQ